MRFILDTCVISELVRPRPDRGVVEWIRGRDEESLFLSVICLGELRKGIERLPPSERKRTLLKWIDSDLRDRFRGRVIPIDSDVADRWGSLLADMERKGRPVPVIDALLAATALVHEMTIVTRNTRDMAGTGALLLNPWKTGGE